MKIVFLLAAMAVVPSMAQASAPVSKDSRAAVVQICTAEAQRRGAAMGATDVSIRELNDTDVKSGHRASMHAEMNVVTTDKKGKVKTKRYNIACDVRDGVITSFKVR